MSIIHQLKQQNERLIQEKLQTEKDMAIVANNFKEAWDSLGLDFSKMNQSNGDKPSIMAITSIALSLGKRMMSGQIKVADLIKKWESCSPILEKYQHVMDQHKIEKNV